MNKKAFQFVILAFFLVALSYRVYGLWENNPFWVDEYSSANQARLILNYGLNLFNTPGINIEQHNIVTHALIALSFKFLGEHEWTARLPFAVVGALVPILVLLVARKLFDTRIAIGAALLTTFSYFQIAWSRQARGYVLVQLLVLATIYLYIHLKRRYRGPQKKDTFRLLFLLTICIALGFYTHAFYLIFLCAVGIDLLFFNIDFVKKYARNPFAYLFVLLLIVISALTGHLDRIVGHIVTSNVFHVNNIWYYHSFLWREYVIITFLALVGFIVSAAESRRDFSLIIIYVVLHLLFINFFFSAYVTRYLLPIFPFLFIAVSVAVVRTVDSFLKQQKLEKRTHAKSYAALIIIVFIIANGYKFVTKPKAFYSVNHDFREIALIDYHQIYDIIRTKGKLNEGKTAVIDTWHDRLYWYLGSDFRPAYIFRWINEPGEINGLEKKTDFTYNSQGEKVLQGGSRLRFIGELSDLKKAIQKYPRGFIFIDDSSLPKDVRDYAEKNFKKEIYLDHYPLDDNPYSVWPATLYSWGV